MDIQVYNTMSKRVENFKPLKEKEVGIFTCGPTVYWYAHIGNLRAYVFADILKRMFMYNGYKVKHVMNITDVGHLISDSDTGEDKMEKAKEREGKSAWDIAKFYEKAFFEDTKKLNIIKPEVVARATEEIDAQIELIKKIEENGYTYQIEDGVYFDTSKLKDYGKLINLDVTKLKAGARVEMVEGKKNPTDFALWKFSPKDKKRDMEWDSPWGIGFPGWHIECSAMSMKYLGETFDVHTGGIDHIPIHHTNEIAQSVAANGVEPVKYWLHNEFLIEKDGKMSKSEGKILVLSVLLEKGYSAIDYRYLLLTSSYRKQLFFTWEGLNSAKNTMEKLRKIVLEIKSEEGKVNEVYKKEFNSAINDDLNTPVGLAVMWKMLKDENLNNEDKYQTLLDFDKVLGLELDKIEEEKVEVPEDIKILISKRDEARKNKNWELSDKIREEIKSKGFIVEDTKEGTKVIKK